MVWNLYHLISHSLSPACSHWSGYIAPEVNDASRPWNQNVISSKADVFSLEIIVIEILSHTLKGPIYTVAKRTGPMYAIDWLQDVVDNHKMYVFNSHFFKLPSHSFLSFKDSRVATSLFCASAND